MEKNGNRTKGRLGYGVTGIFTKSKVRREVEWKGIFIVYPL